MNIKEGVFGALYPLARSAFLVRKINSPQVVFEKKQVNLCCDKIGMEIEIPGVTDRVQCVRIRSSKMLAELAKKRPPSLGKEKEPAEMKWK